MAAPRSPAGEMIVVGARSLHARAAQKLVLAIQPRRVYDDYERRPFKDVVLVRGVVLAIAISRVVKRTTRTAKTAFPGPRKVPL